MLGWTDNCDGNGQVLGTDQSDGNTCPETITRTWTYTDACGNTSSVFQLITVDDNIPPVFDPPPAPIAYECIFDVPAPGMLGWTDNCDGSGQVVGTDQSDGNTCPETITRTWTYTDACGNTSSVNQIITVGDDVPPVFDTPPAPLDFDCFAEVPAPGMLGWTDNCDGAGQVVGTDQSDGASCPETITRTWTYTDACGNTSSVNQIISIDDAVPAIYAPSPPALDPICFGEVPAPGILGWTDNCDG